MTDPHPPADLVSRASRSTTIPQRATASDAIVSSVEWFFEPCWQGDRLLAHVEAGQTALYDASEELAGPEREEAATVIGAAVRADQALLDGVWTAQPFVGDAAWQARRALDVDVPLVEMRRAFVAFDLVELDGDLLHDFPYQERRRLLSSVVDETVRVRITPAVKLPIGPWLMAWRANGFTHYVAKHMNSRYRPGSVCEDWLLLEATQEAGPSIMGRLFGQRPKRRPRIEDRRPG